MSLSGFLTSRLFLKNLFWALALVIICIIITMQGLKIYTRHGLSNPVPDFSGMSPEMAMNVARQNDLRIKIIDSVFIDEAAPGVIVDQVPETGHGVKKGRTVFLTVNSIGPEMVTLPQLTDISFRQAKALVENSGLNIGEIIYKPSEYNNLVLDVTINSASLSTGQKLPKGTSVDLIVGRESSNMSAALPNLTGMTLEQAKKVLTDAMLNTGVVIYDESVLSSEDSLKARVWRQHPNPKITGTSTVGSFVDLWVTTDQLKIDDSSEEFF
ncbi:MAG: PASTA domain-containing protein [Prolixibacteraceae bacterium]|nr:PASTA domain-containing protein [Prolixibacteraceae bacterium]